MRSRHDLARVARTPPHRVAFLYAHEPSKEFADIAAGTVPTHRVFGALDVSLDDVEALWFSWPRRWPRAWRGDRVWRVVQALRLLSTPGVSGTVCTTEASAPPVLLLRALRLIRHDVVVVNVACLKSANARGLRRRILGRLLRQARAVCSYARSQVPGIVEQFGVPAHRSLFVPLGVDTRYFAPDPAHRDTGSPAPLTLFAGTNEAKDMATLMMAVTGGAACIVVTDEQNVARAASSRPPDNVTFRMHVPIAELRQLYREATHLVLPLTEGTTSSGQTVLLENMVMGRRPIVSDVSYVRDYVTHDRAVLVPPGDPEALRRELDLPSVPLSPHECERVRNEHDIRRLADTLAMLALTHPRGREQPPRRKVV